MASALQKALSGGKVGESQAKGALADAVKKINNMKAAKRKVESRAEHAGGLLIGTVETNATAAINGFVQGAYGDKLRLGGVDVRKPAVVVGYGASLVGALGGRGWASHVMRLTDGVTASMVAIEAYSAGQSYAAKKGGVIGDGTGDDLREIELEPAPALEGGGLQPAESLGSRVFSDVD